MSVTPRPVSAPALGVALLALLALAGSLAVGPLAALAVVALVLVVVLLSRPDWALGVAVALPVLVESEPSWGPSAFPSRLYELVPGTKITPAEGLVLIALLAALLDRWASGRRVDGPGLLSPPVLVLGLALLIGAVTGYDAGIGVNGAVNGVRGPLLLLVLPVVVVLVVPSRVSLRTALWVLVALAAIKAAAGLAALATGQTARDIGGQGLTYYDAPANILTMVVLLGAVAAWVRRVALPTWVWAAAPVIAACLLLSYRRSFWVALALGVVLILLFGIQRASRRFAVPAAIALAVALALTLGGATGSGLRDADGSGGGLGGRLQSLNPAAISQSKDDRYRIGERRNVWAEIEEHPVFGIGFGVPYTQRYPLSFGDIDHSYVHFAVLWWWLKTGLVGALGYLGLFAAGIWAGAQVLRRHPDPLVGAAGLAGAAALTGYVVAETTATFTGADPRSCILAGALLGLLAAAHRELPPAGAARP